MRLHVTKGETVSRRSRPVCGDAVNGIVRRSVRHAGLAHAESFSAHSFRTGFIIEAKNRGVDAADIMEHTRHKSLATMPLYDRTSGWSRPAIEQMPP